MVFPPEPLLLLLLLPLPCFGVTVFLGVTFEPDEGLAPLPDEVPEAFIL